MADDRGLERAILAGAAAYGPKRVLLRHRPTPTAGVNGRRCYTRKAGCDFDGTLAGGRRLVMEAKAVLGDSLPNDRVKQHQRDELAQVAALGGEALLVVSFDFLDPWSVSWTRQPRRETFTIAWPAVADFFARPWRQSLTLAHARAVGLHVPDEEFIYRRVMFLDGEPHPLRDRAQEELEREKVAARLRRAARVQEPAPAPASADALRRRARAATAAGEKSARRRT